MSKTIADLRKTLDKVLLERNIAEKRAEEETEALEKARKLVENTSKAVCLVQEIAETVQNQVHTSISHIVSRCLEAIFGENSYKFRIDFCRARNKTEARLFLERDGEKIDPLDASGGGVVDVCAFALRIAAVLLSTPPKRRFLALDEPFRMLSREYRPRARELLEVLCREHELQVLMVTHSPELCTGKVIEING